MFIFNYIFMFGRPHGGLRVLVYRPRENFHGNVPPLYLAMYVVKI